MTTPPAEPPRVGRHAADRDAPGPAPTWKAAAPTAPAHAAAPPRPPAATAPAPATPAVATPARTQVPNTIGDLLTTMSEVAREAGRNDLVSRLDGARTRITDPRLRIVVVGQLKQGKSSFVNALLNLDVCSVGDDETTAVPTVISHAAQPSAHLVVDGPAADNRIPVPMDAIAGITPDSPLAGGREVLRLEIEAPGPLLADGLVLVDTPGVGGHGHPYAAATLGMVAAADAVLVVSDASQEFTAPEMSFLQQVAGLCPTIACLITKTDLYPHWRAVVDADRTHLHTAGLDIPLLPVSSVLRTHALRLGDEKLNAEAGFLDLYRYLRERVVSTARQATRTTVATDLRVVSEHLALTLGSELAALRDPETAGRAVGALREAKSDAEAMRRQSAQWQQTLADGIADLAADIDHDLRDRLRAVTREAERAIDEGDPGVDWEQLSEWLADQTAAVIGDNFVWAHERSVWLAERVADHFAAAGQNSLPDIDVADLTGVLDSVAELAELDSGRVGLAQKLLIGMRGSYGGVLMFGLISTMVGMALINPVSVGAGLLLGTKAYRDDKEAKVLERRAKAKVAVRAFTDDVSFQVGKESRDRLRVIQRVLRDHFTSVAEQTARSISESLSAAQSAATLADSERSGRVAELESRLTAVAALRKAADHLDPEEPAAELPRR
ncbi:MULTISPECIES: dynamin family protein [unclassified Gordonia (in: high G+C Gram-positive bacteria)]|uniref:dynamin family protein n=1 Tax=unclassified Gordonia (in: high G+C Gram-positive bacteria) TaxID=2657482 RepID=UPI0010F5409E|nr:MULTISPECIES: dynamin family protein [unclassified Gordonia (in: high G+C Gram-positive bacteria)]